MKIVINITKKQFFIITGIFLILISAFGVYAYRSGGPPSVFGHSADEIEVNLPGGTTTTLNDFVTNVNTYTQVVVKTIGVDAQSGLSVNRNDGDVVVSNAAWQNRITGSCQTGQFIRTINADGSVVCN